MGDAPAGAVTSMRATVALLGCAMVASAIAGPARAAPRGQPPSPPAITPGTRTFVAMAGRPALVRLAWPALPNIARYRARWVQAGAPIDVELPGTATSFEREVLLPGHHKLTVVAINAAGRESAPVEIGIDVVEVKAFVPGANEPTATSVPAYAVGTRFQSPGLRCRIGDGPEGADATAQQPGAAMLRCGVQDGPRVEVGVVIAPVLIDAPKHPLVRGTASKLHLTVASVARLGEHLDVEAVDAELGEVRRTEHGFEIAVTPRDGAVTANLIVRSRKAASADGDRGVPLGQIELLVAQPPAPPEPGPPRTAWFALDLGYHVGVFVPTGDPPAIGKSDREVIRRPLGGVRIGLFPTRRVGAEVELALAAPDYRPGQHTWLVAGRAQVAARVLELGDLGLRLVGGAGVLSTTGAVHYGGAFTFETRRNLWLRLEALHAITVARDSGYAHCLELQLGVVTRIGRADRGW